MRKSVFDGEFSALRGEPCQKVERGLIHRFHLGNIHVIVSVITDDEFAVFDFSVTLDYIFVAVVVGDVFRTEFLHRAGERIFDVLYRKIIHVPVIRKIRGLYRMKNENVHSVFAFRKHVSERGEIVVEFPEFIEPRHMFGIGVRVISLSLPSYRISGKMLTHKIYAVHVLPFGDAFEFLRSNVPPATRDRFG